MIRDLQRGLHISGSTARQRIAAMVFGIIIALIELTSAAEPAIAPNLVSVVIRGSSVYAAPALFDVYREQLGKPITAEGARAIARSLAANISTTALHNPPCSSMTRCSPPVCYESTCSSREYPRSGSAAIPGRTSIASSR